MHSNTNSLADCFPHILGHTGCVKVHVGVQFSIQRMAATKEQMSNQLFSTQEMINAVFSYSAFKQEVTQAIIEHFKQIMRVMENFNILLSSFQKIILQQSVGR